MIVDLNFVEKYASLIPSSLENDLNGIGKMSTEYSKIILNGKNAILFTGKGTKDFNADYNFYYIESSDGVVILFTIRKYEDNDPQTLKDAKAAVESSIK